MGSSGWGEHNGNFNTKKKVTVQVICNTEMEADIYDAFSFELHEHHAISFMLDQAFCASENKELLCRVHLLFNLYI